MAVIASGRTEKSKKTIPIVKEEIIKIFQRIQSFLDYFTSTARFCMLSRGSNKMMMYPSVEPFASFELKVSSQHTLYVEQVGNPSGIPILFLHGGPGSGIDSLHRQLFDPEAFHVILFDQRGCGKSTPYGSLEDNTTAHLIEDIEAIRKHLKISKWHLFGGSWGSFLALAYAEAWPDNVLSLILRGLFLGRAEELEFFYQKGASFLFPEVFEEFTSLLSNEEKKSVISSFYKHLNHQDPTHVLKYAKKWALYEASCLKLINTQKTIQDFAKHERLISLAKIETHYFVNGCFVKKDQLLDEAKLLEHIPITVVHGRYDVICPIENAFLLKNRLPHLKLLIAPASGHSYLEEEILQFLIQELDLIKQDHKLRPASSEGACPPI